MLDFYQEDWQTLVHYWQARGYYVTLEVEEALTTMEYVFTISMERPDVGRCRAMISVDMDTDPSYAIQRVCRKLCRELEAQSIRKLKRPENVRAVLEHLVRMARWAVTQ